MNRSHVARSVFAVSHIISVPVNGFSVDSAILAYDWLTHSEKRKQSSVTYQQCFMTATLPEPPTCLLSQRN